MYISEHDNNSKAGGSDHYILIEQNHNNKIGIDQF
jgi:hypothetical protein